MSSSFRGGVSLIDSGAPAQKHFPRERFRGPKHAIEVGGASGLVREGSSLVIGFGRVPFLRVGRVGFRHLTPKITPKIHFRFVVGSGTTSGVVGEQSLLLVRRILAPAPLPRLSNRERAHWTAASIRGKAAAWLRREESTKGFGSRRKRRARRSSQAKW